MHKLGVRMYPNRRFEAMVAAAVPA